LGVFSLVPQKNKNFSLIAYNNGEIIKKNLPSPQQYGQTISIDRNHQREEFVITINSKSTTSQKLILIIHKDGNLIDLPPLKNNLEKQAILVPYDAMESGMNTVSLLNAEGKILAERIIFHKPVLNTLKIELKKLNSFNDSVSVAFQTSALLQNAMLSASILPGNSRTSYYEKKAFYSIHLEQYIDLQDWQNLSALNCQTFQELYYLDNVTLLAKPKYKWSSILNKELVSPNQKELTTTLDGYINTFEEKNESLQVLLYSKENNLLAATDVDDEKKFEFENIVLTKNSKFTLTLSNNRGKPVYANFFYTIKPDISNFRYRYQPKQFDLENIKLSTSDKLQSAFKKIEQLEEVVVTANQLKYEKIFGGYYGIKVDSTIGMNILKDFLSRQGFYSMFISPLFPDGRRAG
jgi:uncharacterized protein YkuJ